MINTRETQSGPATVDLTLLVAPDVVAPGRFKRQREAGGGDLDAEDAEVPGQLRRAAAQRRSAGPAVHSVDFGQIWQGGAAMKMGMMMSIVCTHPPLPTAT